MKTHLTYLIIIGVLAAILFYLFDRNLKNKLETEQLKGIIEEKSAEIIYRKNENGRILAQKKASELTTKQLQEAYPLIVKEIQKEFDLKIKDVKAYIRNEFEARGSGNSTINHYTYTDSAGNKYPIWKLKVQDQYLDFSATVYDSLHAPYEYVYRDTISTVVSVKKKWIFGDEKLYATSMLKNQNAKVTGATNLLINNYRDKRFTLGPVVYFDPFSQKFGIGVGAGYALFKF